MAYTTPTTQTAGTGLSSTAYNTLVNDILFLALKPFIVARRTTTQSVANSADVKIGWPTTDRTTSVTLGTDGATASSRFTPAVAGWYTIVVNLVWGASISNYPKVVHSDGTAMVGPQGTSNYGHVSTVMRFNGSSDFVEVFAVQFSGITQNLAAGSRCAITWERFDT